MEQLLGIIYHFIGGFSSASFYVPYNRVKQWAWGTYWIVLGFVAWMIMPVFGGYLVSTDLWGILIEASSSSRWMTYFYGFLWGFGGLLSGLGLRFLGLSLGQSISLGVSAIVGTVVPAVLSGKFYLLYSSTSGLVILFGFLICIIGISCCGYAGILKDRALPSEQKQEAVKEFAALKGFIMALFGGILSACMALAIHAGLPIAEAALKHGTDDVFINIPIFVLALAGGFTSNFLFYLINSFKKANFSDYNLRPRKLLLNNYLMAVFSGIMWYGQFFFYGMGATKMGDYEFASWSIHMSSIIIFSNFWGLYLGEWKSVPKAIVKWLWIGILLLIFSVLIIGWGNHMAG